MAKKISKTNFKSNNMIIYLLFGIFILILIVFFINNKKMCENFINDSLNNSSDGNVKIHYYYMEGCGYCDQFSNSGIWESLNDNLNNNAEFIKKNIAENKDDINKYNISGFPCILAIDKNNNKLAEYEGDRSYKSLEKFVQSFI
jgi:thioredoxin-related protein